MTSKSAGQCSRSSVTRTARLTIVTVLFIIFAQPLVAHAQAGFDDDRVMLQGFYWEASRHGYPQIFPQFGAEHWYMIIKREAPTIRAAGFDLVWLPPPSFAGGCNAASDPCSAGYDPREYFVLDNSYGSGSEQRAALEALLTNGVEPV